MPHDEFVSLFILLGFVGMIAFGPIIVITVLLCARFKDREPEERRYKIKEEVCIGIGEFVAFFLEYTVAFLEAYYHTDLFFRPIVRQIDGWAGVLLLFVSLYLLNRIIILIIFKRERISEIGTSVRTLFARMSNTGRTLLVQMNKTVRLVLLTVIILVVAVFSLFRIVTINSTRVYTDLGNKYPGYILCEMGSGHKLMFSWNYYRLKGKVEEDLQALLEEAKAEKKWISEYEIEDQCIYIDTVYNAEISEEERDMLERNEDPFASSFSNYYVYLGDYGDRIMEQFMILKVLAGKAGSGTEDELIYQNIKFNWIH